MKYSGMPHMMWYLFKKSFKKNLVLTLNINKKEAKLITKKSKIKYKEILSKIPEFEKGDRFKINIISCTMFSAFYLNLTDKPSLELMN